MAARQPDSADAGAQGQPAELKATTSPDVAVQAANGQVNRPNIVSLTAATRQAQPDLLLWYVIKKSTDNLDFRNYQAYIDLVMCGDRSSFDDLRAVDGSLIRGRKRESIHGLYNRRYLPYTDSEAYRLLKVATEAFVTVHCGVPLVPPAPGQDVASGILDGIDLGALLKKAGAEASGDLLNQWWNDYLQAVNGMDNLTLPYLMLIRRKLKDEPIIELALPPGAGEMTDDRLRLCYGILVDKLSMPCFVELIWNYWMENGMLVQTMNALSRRFQNIRGPADQDPLAMVELDPLRPLNNLLWGYIQDEQHRLSVVRRAYEYDHHYGLSLEGKAIPPMRTADSRSRFLEAFHNLLYLVSAFYKQDDDTTVIADAFPVLNALKDVHMLLSEGAHNQFGDLPSTARIEMLMQQWLLARPEFREALPTRTMVAYPEPWMDRVDAMKKLQGWVDTSITHFRNLAVYGEQLLLSVRYGAWSDVDDSEQAAIWARFWRPQIQGYIHAYRTATGVELTAEATWQQQRQLALAQPSTLLLRRRQDGRSHAALPAPASQKTFRERKAERQKATG